jgi:hypothetical protein
VLHQQRQVTQPRWGSLDLRLDQGRHDRHLVNHHRLLLAGDVLLQAAPRPVRKRHARRNLGAARRVAEHLVNGPLHIPAEARPKGWIPWKGGIVRSLNEAADEAVSEVIVRALAGVDAQHQRLSAIDL